MKTNDAYGVSEMTVGQIQIQTRYPKLFKVVDKSPKEFHEKTRLLKDILKDNLIEIDFRCFKEKRYSKVKRAEKIAKLLEHTAKEFILLKMLYGNIYRQQNAAC